MLPLHSFTKSFVHLYHMLTVCLYSSTILGGVNNFATYVSETLLFFKISSCENNFVRRMLIILFNLFFYILLKGANSFWL